MSAARSWTLGAAMAAAALLLVACGGGSSPQVSASSYVKSICQAVKPFERDLQAKAGALNLSAVRSPAKGKHGLQAFLSTAAADDQRAVNQLKAAGTPKVGNGKQISGAIVGAFTQLHTALGQAVSSAGSLPTGNTTAFKSSALALEMSVRNSMSSIGSSLNGLRSSALQSAARQEPACRTLGG